MHHISNMAIRVEATSIRRMVFSIIPKNAEHMSPSRQLYAQTHDGDPNDDTYIEVHTFSGKGDIPVGGFLRLTNFTKTWLEYAPNR